MYILHEYPLCTLARFVRELVKCLDAPVRQAKGTVVVSPYGIGLMIESSLVRLPAGSLPGNLGQLSLPSIRGR